MNFLLRKGLLLLAGNESGGGDSKNSDGLHNCLLMVDVLKMPNIQG